MSRPKSLGVSIVVCVSIAIMSACGQDSDSGSDATMTVDYVFTSSLNPSEINRVAPLVYGGEYELDITEASSKELNSSQTATQVLLSGATDVAAGSFIALMQAVEQGNEMRAFCPFKSGFSAVIVGIGEADDLADLTDPATRVAIEGPGGPTNFFFDLVLRARGLDFRTADLPSTEILSDVSLRFAALLNDDADVGLIAISQIPELEAALGADQVHVLSEVMADAGSDSISLAFFAEADWLAENSAAAAAFCASILRGNREIASSYDLFVELVEEHVEGRIPEEAMRAEWDGVREHEIWAYNDGLERERVEGIVEVAADSGILDAPLDYEDLVDRGPLDAALELVGGEVSADEIRSVG